MFSTFLFLIVSKAFFFILGPWSPPVNIRVKRTQYRGELFLNWDVSKAVNGPFAL
jgi:hypothetical protein